MSRRAGRSLGDRQACLSQDYVQAMIYLSTEGFRAPAPSRKLFPPSAQSPTQFTPPVFLACKQSCG